MFPYLTQLLLIDFFLHSGMNRMKLISLSVVCVFLIVYVCFASSVSLLKYSLLYSQLLS
jgi:hypothetical protein